MKITVTKEMFIDRFADMGRGHEFSRAGRAALFDELEEVSPDMELDVIALCCEYSEAKGPVEYLEACMTADQFKGRFAQHTDPNELAETCLEYLYRNAHVIEFEGGIVASAF